MKRMLPPPPPLKRFAPLIIISQRALSLFSDVTGNVGSDVTVQ